MERNYFRNRHQYQDRIFQTQTQSIPYRKILSLLHMTNCGQRLGHLSKDSYGEISTTKIGFPKLMPKSYQKTLKDGTGDQLRSTP